MAFIPVMEHGTRLVIKCNFAHGQGHIFNCVGVSLHTCFCTCHICIRLKVHICAIVHLRMLIRAYEHISHVPNCTLVKRIHLTIKLTWAMFADLQ